MARNAGVRHLAASALDAPKHLVLRPHRVSLLSLGGDRHQVGQTRSTGWRVERGFEDVRVVEVLALRGERVAGRIAKCPPRAASSSAPNSDGLSKRGQQSHSIEPVREISAAERQSPMMA